jgi:hypothetical protein
MVGTKGPAGSNYRVSGVPPVSAELREKKLAEARENSAKGSKCLQTSVFQWSPDHITAATYFEMSAEAYKVAGDLENAKLMYLQVPYDFSCAYTCLTSLHMIARQAAESFEGAGSPASAALALAKAAKVAQVLAIFMFMTLAFAVIPL